MRQQGIEPRSTAWKATMLTITPLSLLVSACKTSCVDFLSKKRLLSHLHIADISFFQSNFQLVAITKSSESDLGKQKEFATY